MEKIEVSEALPIIIGKTSIVSLSLKPQRFVTYMEALTAARQSDQPMPVAMFREWTIRHVEARNISDEVVQFKINDLLMFPAKYARQLAIFQRSDSSPEGEVVKDGDGTSAPCVYKLGTALDAAGGITELEFLAKTIGDIESVITSETRFEQADALIRNCAVPLGSEAKLQRLPDSAMAQLTLADAMVVMQKVLPRFLG